MKLLLTWLALPIALWQGLAVRRRTERLVPPSGPHEGVTGPGEATIRLLVIGDSSAAGVGVGRIGDGMGPLLAALMADKAGQVTHWRVAGFNSATSGQIRDHVVKHLPRDGFTHIVLSVGTNDAKNFHTLARFKREFGGLIYALKARFPSARLVWSPIVEMRDVPALPRPLADILSVRAHAFNSLGSRLARERGGVAATPLPVKGPGGFAVDGFHAGALGYAAWAEHLLPFVTGD
ncbi:MAG: SGNH/GDSL hydrolase family protein [Phyllobacteriaceae bacterium]|nr:SGNH/GDSL hydrolase family protein [Phyllobacteriaceae bacterium]